MPIKFLRQYSIYNKGDVVAFNKDIADRLVAEGRAEHFNPAGRPSVLEKAVKKSK